jgi:uncharacterized membrane protein
MALTEFLGRLHPVAVHLPIGIAVAAAIAEGLALLKRRPVAGETARLLVALAAFFSVPAAVFGWLNASTSNHPEMETIVEWHRWLGIATAALLFFAWIASRYSGPASPRSLKIGYLMLLAASVVIMGVTGHLGGILVYGEDYLAL